MGSLFRVATVRPSGNGEWRIPVDVGARLDIHLDNGLIIRYDRPMILVDRTGAVTYGLVRSKVVMPDEDGTQGVLLYVGEDLLRGASVSRVKYVEGGGERFNILVSRYGDSITVMPEYWQTLPMDIGLLYNASSRVHDDHYVVNLQGRGSLDLIITSNLYNLLHGTYHDQIHGYDENSSERTLVVRFTSSSGYKMLLAAYSLEYTIPDLEVPGYVIYADASIGFRYSLSILPKLRTVMLVEPPEKGAGEEYVDAMTQLLYRYVASRFIDNNSFIARKIWDIILS